MKATTSIRICCIVQITVDIFQLANTQLVKLTLIVPKLFFASDLCCCFYSCSAFNNILLKLVRYLTCHMPISIESNDIVRYNEFIATNNLNKPPLSNSLIFKQLYNCLLKLKIQVLSFLIKFLK